VANFLLIFDTYFLPRYLPHKSPLSHGRFRIEALRLDWGLSVIFLEASFLQSEREASS